MVSRYGLSRVSLLCRWRCFSPHADFCKLHSESIAKRQGRFIVLSLVCIALAEQAYITSQAALGQASHFNFSTPLHGFIYSLVLVPSG